MTDGFDLNALLAEYREEARQQLDHLDQSLVAIEESGALSEADRKELLRVLHTLKGNSAMVGLRPIAERVHEMETVFKESPPEGLRTRLDGLFELSATIRSAVQRVGGPDEQPALARLEELAGSSDRPPEPGAQREESSVRPPPHPPAAPSDADAPPAGETATDQDDAEAVTAGGSTEILRVPFRSLDRLLTQVGELVGLHARFEEFIETHRAALEEANLLRELEERTEDVAMMAGALRDTTMSLRLVPLRTLFGRYPSLVRELARDRGKRVRLVVEGAEIELDKSAVDALGEPLLHLLRNAVDHGIEDAETREASGKDPVGTVHLRAMREADQIRIEVSDDGSGLDRAAILRRAREVGLQSAAAAESDEALWELLFTPGFSTRAEATTVSGRGMGLDIVRRSVVRLRGSLQVVPTPEGGTAFALRIPLTLAIVSALIFEIDGETLAIPTTEVRETLSRRVTERVGGTEVVRDGEGYVPLASPARIFGWKRSEPVARGGAAEAARFAIVLHRGERTVALPADRLIDQRNVVVKALPPYLGAPRGVSGATIGPDGRVVLLLDTQGVLDLNLESQRSIASGG